MSRRAWGAIAVAAVIVATGCGARSSSADDLATTPAGQLFREARSNLSAAQFVTERHELDRAGVHQTITLTSSAHGDGAGSWQVGEGTADFVYSGGRYWQRPDRLYLAAQGRNDTYAQKVLPGHWEVVAGAHPVKRGAVELVGGGVFKYLAEGGDDLRKGVTEVVDGVRVLELTNASGRLFISVADPHRLVRAAWRDSVLKGVTNWTVDFSYPTLFNIAPPAQFYDPLDLATLPARHRVTRDDVAACDANQCRFVASVTNDYGAQVGQSSLTIHVTDAGNTEVTSCSTDLPAIAHGGSADVGCAVGGGSWSSFYTGRGAGAVFHYQAAVHDALWDS